MNAKIERLAAALADAWRNGTTIALPGAADAPASRAEAYAVQDRLAELSGERVVGWKVGAAIEAVQRLEGHDGPIPGRLFASRVFDSPATIPGARFGMGHKVECEFGFRFTRDLSARGPKQTATSIAEAMTFHPAIEIAGSRYVPGTGGRSSRTHDTIADNGGGGAFVFGPAIADWRKIDFDHLPIDARIDGGGAIQVYAGDLRRDPVAIAAETVNDLVARGVGFKAGDYLSTGSLTMPTPIGRGQSFVARFGELASLRVTLSP
jgi:2-keto-4-pentenoate hydratase